ncbi:MAG TPA: NADH-quinone oxidoreductase subunit J [Chitinophagaceae bacterium]
MTGSTIIFYLLAALTLVCGLVAVSTRKIFHAAIALLFSLIGVAGLYFWMQYEFIAAVQTVVYVGGIVVLIIFSVFLTQQAGDQMPRQSIGRRIFGGLATFLGFSLTMVQVVQHTFTPTTAPAADNSVAGIGRLLLSVDETGYALPFEVISMLLLAAMVGCIVIAMRQPAPTERPEEPKQPTEETIRFTTITKEPVLPPVEEEIGGVR